MTPATCRKCGKALTPLPEYASDVYYCACPENDWYERMGVPRRPITPINPHVLAAVRYAIVSGEFHRTLAERQGVTS